MSHRDLQWMCAACGWVHYPVRQDKPQPTALERYVYVAPDECENCQHRPTLNSWIHVKWLDWYGQWDVTALPGPTTKGD